ncbi:MAG TPA: sigma-70 family RNA polymerase sigma factor [Bryobacteraceae bacterium]|nr:sigma-70 family RNA polymerase sigma factor [Bryobacteraceae bacterium]
MTGLGEAVAEASAGETPFDLERLFRSRYAAIARLIAGIVRDRACAEELAVDVFLRWSRARPMPPDTIDGWLYRAAVRIALDELRREARRSRYERLLTFFRGHPGPEEVRAAGERNEQVRNVLRSLSTRQAEMLLLRANGFSYSEVATALGLNAASVGTLLARAEESFRKEFVRRYGDEY